MGVCKRTARKSRGRVDMNRVEVRRGRGRGRRGNSVYTRGSDVVRRDEGCHDVLLNREEVRRVANIR